MKLYAADLVFTHKSSPARVTVEQHGAGCQHRNSKHVPLTELCIIYLILTPALRRVGGD